MGNTYNSRGYVRCSASNTMPSIEDQHASPFVCRECGRSDVRITKNGLVSNHGPRAAVQLSGSAINVLRKLDRDGACPTTTSTMGRYVAGTVVAGLERRGLVQSIAPTSGCPERMYGITNAGRQALREAKS